MRAAGALGDQRGKEKDGLRLVGKVCAVIFSPEHLLLVKEGPARRRGFLDGALCQIRPGYAGTLHVYHRALSQRNALLKDISRFPELRDTLEVWDARLIQLGAAVMEERRRYVEKIFPRAQEIYHGISRGKEELSLAYAPPPHCRKGPPQRSGRPSSGRSCAARSIRTSALALPARGPTGTTWRSLWAGFPPGCTAPRGSSAAPCWP